MNAFNRIRAAATKLSIGARANSDPDKLREMMIEVGNDLDAMLDELVDDWNALRASVKKIDGSKS